MDEQQTIDFFGRRNTDKYYLWVKQNTYSRDLGDKATVDWGRGTSPNHKNQCTCL